MKAMILAAGEGTRLRPFTLALPKPAIPFLGVPLADYGIRLLDELGPCDLVVNLHHLAPDIRKLFGRPQLSNRKIEFSDESAALLGSGGGIHKAEPFLNIEKNFATINGDEIILPHRSGQIREAYEEHVKTGRLATLLVIEHPEVGAKFGGVWCAPDERQVQTFSRTQVVGLKGWHYIGITFFSSKIFTYFKPDMVEENILYETLTKALEAGKEVKIHPIQAEWFETGNPKDFKTAMQVCLDEMESENPAPWAKELRNFIGRQPLQESLVEKDETLLMHHFEKFKKSLATRP